MIIAISGKIGSGKTTLAKMLSFIISYKIHTQHLFGVPPYSLYKEVVAYPFKSITIISFAKTIKMIVSSLTGCDIEDLYNQDFKNTLSNYKVNNKYLTYRELLIHIGDTFRKDDPDVFVNALFNRVKNISIIIDDLRFINEYKAIKERNGIFIRLNTVKESINHVSECELDNYEKAHWDYVLNERLTELELYNFARRISQDIQIRYGI